MRARRPRGRHEHQEFPQLDITRWRDGMGRLHARQAQRLVGRPQLPDPFQLRGAEAQRAIQSQWLVGQVEDAGRRHVEPVDARAESRHRLAQRAGGIAEPGQGRGWRRHRRGIVGSGVIGLPRRRAWHQSPGACRSQVVAIAMPRQRDRATPPPRHGRRESEDEFARAAGDHDALGGDTMEARQTFPQGVIARIGITRRIGVPHRRQHLRAGSAGIGIGREIVPHRWSVVGAAMQEQRLRVHDRLPATTARPAITTRPATSSPTARPPARAARRTSPARGAGAVAFSA